MLHRAGDEPPPLQTLERTLFMRLGEPRFATTNEIRTRMEYPAQPLPGLRQALSARIAIA
jgi:hypothetical protein